MNIWNIYEIYIYSESNEIGELETSPSNIGEDCPSVDMMAEWQTFIHNLVINYKLHIITYFINNILVNLTVFFVI